MPLNTIKAHLWLFYKTITSGSQVKCSQFNKNDEVFKTAIIEVAACFGLDLPSAITKVCLEILT